MTELTDDEFTVLLIAERGESMMPIGQWEKPVNDLAERGLLQRHDKFNNTITEKGKEALKLHDAKLDHALLTAMNKAAIGAKSVRIETTPDELEEYRKQLIPLLTSEQPPKLPPLIEAMATFINRWPHWEGRTRVRIAVTTAEMQEYRQYIALERDALFYRAVRGVPLVVEEHPTDPLLVAEARE